MTDLITTQLVRLDATWGADKGDVIRGLAAVVNDASARRRPRTAHRRRVRPRGDVEHRPARRHRHPALPHHRRLRADPGLRPSRSAGRLRRQGRPGRPGVPDRGPGGRRRHPPPAPHQAGPLAGQAGVHRLPPLGRDARRGRRADRPGPRRPAKPPRHLPPPGGRSGCRDSPAAAPAAGWAEVARRRHRLPDRHRPHLHGRRGARGRRREGRRRDLGRDPGLGRLHARLRPDDLQRRRP